MSNKQNVIRDFSQLVWQEINSCVQTDMEYNMLKYNGNILILFESNFTPVQQLLSHILDFRNVKGVNIHERNGLVVKLDGRADDDILYIKNSKECFDVCHKFQIRNVIVINPHIHSIDPLYLETLLVGIEKEAESYVYAYEADELSKIVSAERHIESLQLYWHLMSWFAKSDLKQRHIREIETKRF